MEITLIIPELKNENNALKDETAALAKLINARLEAYKAKIMTDNNLIADVNATVVELKKRIENCEATVAETLKHREEIFEKINAATALLNSLEKIAG